MLAIAAAAVAAETIDARADLGVGSWTPTGTLPQPWVGGLAVTLSDGRVLAVAGDSKGTSTDLYEPSAGTWIEGPDAPVSAAASTLVALADGGALLVGGSACSGPQNIAEFRCLPTASAYRLSASGSTWSPAGSMLEARARPTVVRLADGRVLVAGGFGADCPSTFAYGYSCQPLATAEIYAPASNEWSRIRSMPQARGGASAALLSDGTVLLLGGYEGQEALRYDATSASWTPAGETASSRTGALLFALPGDRALVLEGPSRAGFFGSLGTAAEAAPPRCNPTSETFTAATNAWTISPTEPAGSSFCPSGALLAGGQVLLSSIFSYSPVLVVTSPYVLDTEQRCWSTTAPPTAQRDNGTVAALLDGRALVFGGYDASSSLSSAEIYTPGSPTCTTTPIQTPPVTPRFTGVMVVHRRHLTLTAAGQIHILEHCPASAAGSCLGHVQVALAMPSARAKTKSRIMRLFLGDASLAIPHGKTASETVHVTKNIRSLRRLLRRKRRATIIITTSAYEGAGQTAATTASMTLRAQRNRA
ncbi:MAG: Kelch repeat-containing protein [Solirubrobacteraceae bacterium]